MIYVDTNVVMYAVGRPHPLQDNAQQFFARAVADSVPLATSAEVLQELLHAYLPVKRLATLDAAMTLVADLLTVWPLEADDVAVARDLSQRHAGLGARDLVHLAACRRRRVQSLHTYDRALAAAFGGAVPPLPT